MSTPYLQVLTPMERQTRMIGAWLSAHRFHRVDLSNCVFEKACCDNAVFEEVDLRRANFRGAFLRGTRFICCNLAGAVFPAANIVGAEFVGCMGIPPDMAECLLQRGAAVRDRRTSMGDVGRPDGEGR